MSAKTSCVKTFRITAVLNLFLLLTLGISHAPLAAETSIDRPQNTGGDAVHTARVVALENLHLKDAMTTVRSLLALKNIAAIEGTNTLVLRDTADKVELAADLLARLDKPSGEARVAIELLRLDTATAERLAGSGGLPQRLDAAALAELRTAGSVVAAPSLGVLDGQWAEAQTLTGLDLPNPATSGFRVRVRPRVHPGTQQVTLNTDLRLYGALDGEWQDLASLEVSARVESGETWLLSGLGGGEADGETLVVTLTPRIVHAPTFAPEELVALCVGTATRIEICR